MLWPSWFVFTSTVHAIRVNGWKLMSQVIAVGVGHMRASRVRGAIPAMVVMNGLWSALAFATVLLAPHRATSALLMTGVNHLVFASVMVWQMKMGIHDILGLQELEVEKAKQG
jgi:hypothetical protein